MSPGAARRKVFRDKSRQAFLHFGNPIAKLQKYRHGSRVRWRQWRSFNAEAQGLSFVPGICGGRFCWYGQGIGQGWVQMHIGHKMPRSRGHKPNYYA